MGVIALAPVRSLKPIGKPHLDWSLFSIWLALTSIGLVMVSSASISYAAANYGDPWFFAKRHLIYLFIGITAGALVASVPVSIWRRYSGLLFFVAVALLIVVLIPGVGRRVNGSQRWLALGLITVQASEIVKFCAIVFFAGFFERRQQELQQGWRGFLKPIGVVGVLVFLLLLEPDFGSSVVISATVVAMMFLAGVKLWQFVLLMMAGIGGLGLVAVLSPYRLQRLITFLDPWADQFNSGYQLTQSLIAFGRGEWFGVGLGNSVQKLFYLPEAHTDFIFAILAEEFGLLGAIVVIGLFVALVVRILKVAKNGIVSGERFSSYAVFGVGVLMAGQAFVNVGVASGLLPTKGLTLPFISYGGSSLVMGCVFMAFLLRVDWEQRHRPLAEAKSKTKKKGRGKKIKDKVLAESVSELAVDEQLEPGFLADGKWMRPVINGSEYADFDELGNDYAVAGEER